MSEERNYNNAEHESIFRELESINNRLSSIEKFQTSIAVSVGKLEIKSSLWGMMGAGVIFIMKDLFQR